MRHKPAPQTSDALGKSQTLPHVPQLLMFVVVSISQPSVLMPLQSEKPIVHTETWHVPPTHFGVELGTLQTFPHAPQLSTVEFVSVSHPFVGSASHAAVPAAHPSDSPTIGTTMLGTAIPLSVADTTASAGANISAMPVEVYVTSKKIDSPAGRVDGRLIGTRSHWLGSFGGSST